MPPATVSQITKTIAATATPEAIVAATTYFSRAIVLAKKAPQTANTGNVFLGPLSANDAQPYEMAPGAVLVLEAPPGQKLDLAVWYVDVANAADGVVVIYW